MKINLLESNTIESKFILKGMGNEVNPPSISMLKNTLLFCFCIIAN